MEYFIKFIFILLLTFQVSDIYADISEREEVKFFLKGMSEKHGFDTQALSDIFSHVKISDSVLEAISRPAEQLPWYKYRPIFLQSARIRSGVSFWREYRTELEKAEDVYGIPPEIIVAIIGVETRYGKNKGSYKVIDSLSTLAFDYPKRSDFFRGELEHFLLLTREQGLDPLIVKGSYAGAMGIPQFIASSYRNYAIDFDNDHIIDIWNDPSDAIGSIGNYFMRHGWRRGEKIAIRAKVWGKEYKKLLTGELKPTYTAGELEKYGVSASALDSPDIRIKLIELDIRNGKEYWLGFENFYVITRYNHSMLYAMAVFQLANKIKSGIQKLL